MAIFVALAVIAFIAYRVLSPEERLRAAQSALQLGQRVRTYGLRELEPFHSALRARTPRPAVTIALAALNVGVFAGMLFGAGARTDPATMIGWGGSFGPRTTNGEWWRLLTAMFVQPGLLQLLINVGAIVQVGLTLERLVGSRAFAVTYLAAGLFAGLASVWSMPTAVTAGAAGAVFGLYGHLIACSVWNWWRSADLAMPVVAIKRLAPITAAFVLYNLVNAIPAANLAGLTVGILVGIVCNADALTLAPRRTAIAFAVGLTMAVVAAIALRGIADVRPEMRRLTATEESLAGTYEAARARFADRRVTADELAGIIERSILPELQAESARLDALRGVPREEEWRMADARRYLQLRSESWRLRVVGLRNAGLRPDPAQAAKANMTFRTWSETRHYEMTRALGNAEGAERASLKTLNGLGDTTLIVRGG